MLGFAFSVASCEDVWGEVVTLEIITFFTVLLTSGDCSPGDPEAKIMVQFLP